MTAPRKRSRATSTIRPDHKGEAWTMLVGIVVAAVALILLFLVVFVGI